jgi:arylesterase/paraoxonase
MALNKWWLLALGMLIVLSVLIARLVMSAGMLVSVVPHFDGSCEPVTGLSGAEDITIDQDLGIAYISADDRRSWLAGSSEPGAIFSLDLKDSHAEPVNLTEHQERSFHPHGISLYVDEDGSKRLFVINHAAPGLHQVDVFSIGEKGQLNLQESITFPDLISPNDLVAVGNRQFYASNDHFYPPGAMRLLEDFVGLPLSSIAYFDGKEGSLAAKGLRYANGITILPGSDSLFVAETTGRNLLVFQRDSTTGQLTDKVTIPVDTGADNLEWNDAGRLLLTGHPRLLDFMAHAQSRNELSPSQILSIDVARAPITIEEVYLNAGDEISGASVAAQYEDTLLIGSVFEDKILRCALTE